MFNCITLENNKRICTVNYDKKLLFDHKIIKNMGFDVNRNKIKVVEF